MLSKLYPTLANSCQHMKKKKALDIKEIISNIKGLGFSNKMII